MNFNSYFFILVFLPVTLAGYFWLNHIGKRKASIVFLILASLVFFAWMDTPCVLIIIFSALFNWEFSRLFARSAVNGEQVAEPSSGTPSSGTAKAAAGEKVLLALGIIVNLGILFYFKYYNFFIDNLNLIFGRSFGTLKVIMPLGVSFFTFQQIAWLVDSYHGETFDHSCSFLNYVLFTVYFPKVSMGPILLHEDFFPQLEDPEKTHVSAKDLSQGFMMFSVGLFKKVLLAELFAAPVNWAWDGNIGTLSMMDAVLVMVGYTFQIYFDFSGYSDMAAGISKMFRIELPQNFDSPYKALSPIDFWHRWHMTLTRFLRKYIYFPLGGSRKGDARTYLNIFIVYLVSGFWHGASWTFVLWGVVHGVAQVLNRMFRAAWDKINVFIRWVFTFLYVNLTWVLFRADSIQGAAAFFKRLFNFHDILPTEGLLSSFGMAEFMTLFQSHRRLSVLACYAAALLLVTCTRNLWEEKLQPTVVRSIFTTVLFVWSMISFMGVSSFIYFAF